MDSIEVQKSIDVAEDLTTITVTGRLLPNQATKILDDFYKGEYTLNMLWDLSKADLSELSGDDLEGIISFAKKKAHLRPGGRTAFIISSVENYGMGRMYGILAEINDHPIANLVFNEKDIEMAKEWLKGRGPE